MRTGAAPETKQLRMIPIGSMQEPEVPRHMNDSNYRILRLNGTRLAAKNKMMGGMVDVGGMVGCQDGWDGGFVWDWWDDGMGGMGPKAMKALAKVIPTPYTQLAQSQSRREAS